MFIYMDFNSMKNMIVLKDLPSNMVKEAFVVFNDNVKIHKIEKTEKNRKYVNNERKKTKDYILKEAEMIIEDYISKVEKKEYELVNGNRKLKEKYKRLKKLTIFLAIFSAFSTISLFF